MDFDHANIMPIRSLDSEVRVSLASQAMIHGDGNWSILPRVSLKLY